MSEQISYLSSQSSSPSRPLLFVMFKKKSVYYNTLLSGLHGESYYIYMTYMEEDKMVESIQKKIRKEDIEKYIRDYITGYRTFLEEAYPDRKNEFGFYTGYPFEVRAYLSEKSTLITYKSNSASLTIEVFEVDEIPDWRPLQNKVGIHLSSNAYLSRKLNKAQDVAQQEILGFFSQEEYEMEQAELYQNLYYEELEQEMNSAVEGLLSYFDNSYKVKKETSVKHINDIYNAAQLIDNHGKYYSAYLMAECETLADVVVELNKDIESSIFLSLHANYRAANTLLRRWLEVTLIALYFDFKLKKFKNKQKKYTKHLKHRDLWLKKPEHLAFTGNSGVLDTLIDNDTDTKATQLLNLTNPNNKQPFKEYVETVYKELNQHVHYGGRISDSLFDELTFNFVEYNEKRFKEWYNKLNQINEICNIIVLLKFPEMITRSQKYKNDYTSYPTLEDSQLSKILGWQKVTV